MRYFKTEMFKVMVQISHFSSQATGHKLEAYAAFPGYSFLKITQKVVKSCISVSSVVFYPLCPLWETRKNRSGDF